MKILSSVDQDPIAKMQMTEEHYLHWYKGMMWLRKIEGETRSELLLMSQS